MKGQRQNTFIYYFFSIITSGKGDFVPFTQWGQNIYKILYFQNWNFLIVLIRNRNYQNVEAYGWSENEIGRKCILQAENIMPESKKL